MRQVIELTEGQDAVQWLAASDSVSGCHCLSLSHQQYYLNGRPSIDLVAVVCVEAGEPQAIAVLPRHDLDLNKVSNLAPSTFSDWCNSQQLACISLRHPLKLSTVDIPKPWGREVWFTGIEARGQCAVVDDQNRKLLLPWLMAFLPNWLGTGYPQSLTLLKILDPLPEPVFGDLYFEMHEQKQEVYVVTRVDSDAWPDGVGGIRFGFNQRMRADFEDDGAFKQAYLAAVARYKKVRDQIDSLLDEMRKAAGVGINEPVSATVLKGWLHHVPESLQTAEQSLRAELDSFAEVLPLKIGDVVKVPCFTPHSLMHGVTTVEFQTPVYERKILSFAQKVLTQADWDTESAMPDVNLNAPEHSPLPALSAPAGVVREQVVCFDDFSVERWQLSAHHAIELRSALVSDGPETGSHDAYLLVMSLHDGLVIEGVSLAAGEAVLVPAALTRIRLDYKPGELNVAGGAVSQSKQATFLVSQPSGS